MPVAANSVISGNVCIVEEISVRCIGGFVMYYLLKIIFIVCFLFIFSCFVYWTCAVVFHYLDFDELALYFIAVNPLTYKRLPRLCPRSDPEQCKLWNCPEFHSCTK